MRFFFSLSLSSLLRDLLKRMSAARNGIPPDVVRKAEMQMKRRLEDLNGRTRTRRKENDGDDGAFVVVNTIHAI